MSKAKSRAGEYTVSMLPSTRKAVFWDVLKLNWVSFVYYGLLMLLFSLPMLIVGMVENIQLANMVNAQADARALFAMQNTFAVLRIPCFMLLSIALAGFAKVMRQYAWGENVFFSSDFFGGIRANVRQTLLLGTVAGAGYVLCRMLYGIAVFSQEETMPLVCLIGILFVALIGIPVVAYAVVCVSIYVNKFCVLLKIGFLLTVKNPLKTYLALVCYLLLAAVQLLPYMAVQVAGGLLTGLLSPVIFLGWYLFALNGLDETVNKQYFPELVGRGIVWKTDEA